MHDESESLVAHARDLSLALDDLSLDELGERAQDLAGRANSAAVSAVDYAIAAGRVLLEAKRRIPSGEWSAWLTTHFTWSAHRYIRLAYYADVIPAGTPSIAAADRYIVALPPVQRRDNGRREETSERARIARKLVAEGVSQTEIAETFGVSGTTVSRWLNPGKVKRARDRERKHGVIARAWAAEERQRQRDRAVSSSNSDLTHVYAALRKNCQLADRALDGANQQERAALESVILRLHGAEDVIVEALNLGRSHPRGYIAAKRSAAAA